MPGSNTSKSESDRRNQRSVGHVHFVLLNDGAARSQQLRITPNKFRPFPRNEYLSANGRDVINSFRSEATAVDDRGFIRSQKEKNSLK